MTRRYHAGANRLAAMRRAGVRIGTEEMKQLLRTVTTGFTEHSVIAKCNTLELEVAYGNLDGMWDAPDGAWHKFQFDECFIASEPESAAHIKL
jgi:hypothetical protein